MSLSTFHTLQTAKNSLIAHQKGISTVGHNIANQANEDYSRQRIQLGTLTPVDAPGTTSRAGAGQVGSGVKVEQVERIRDEFVDDKILAQRGSTTYWETKEFYLRNMESIYNEPSGPGVKEMFDEFLSAWNGVANDPTEAGSRQTLKATAEEMTVKINKIYEDLTFLRRSADNQIRDKVELINMNAKQIAELNKKIEAVKAEGKNPNDWMDRRDALIEDLSSLADVNVTRRDRNFLVFIGSQILVQGKEYREVKAVGNPNNDGLADIKWADNDLKVQIGTGELRALMDVRDVDAVNQIDKVDNFAVNLAVTVNDIHREGFGLNGQTGIDFFSFRDLPLNKNGDYDSNADGIADSTAIMKVSGTKTMKLNDKLGIRGVINFGTSNAELRQVRAEIDRLSDATSPIDKARLQMFKKKEQSLVDRETIKVEYFETDTVHDVINRINASDANVVAYVNHKGEFTVKALKNDQENVAYSDYIDTPDFAIRHLQDNRIDKSGNVLEESGFFLTSFTGILEKPASGVAQYDWGNTGAVSAFAKDEKTGAIAVNYDVAPMEHPASYLSISKEVAVDINNISARMGDDNTGDRIPDKPRGVANGDTAWKIISTLVSEGERSQVSDFKDKLDSDIVMIDKTNNGFLTYLDRMVQDAGSVAREAVFERENNEVQMHYWNNTRQQISGVSLDEELSTMLTYEHAYRASAKIVTVVDTMIETIINRMGV